MPKLYPGIMLTRADGSKVMFAPKRHAANQAKFDARPGRAAAGSVPKARSTFAKRVLAVVNKKEETKYVSEQYDLRDVSNTLLVPSGLNSILPPLSQGTQSNERIGQKIGSASGKIDFTFILNPGKGSDNTTSHDVKVRVFMLKSKQAKSMTTVPGIAGGTLLDQGDQTTTDWLSALNPLQYEQMPLSKEDFTGSSKVIRLRKNFGLANGGTESSVLTYGQISGRCSLSWKHPSGIMYNDANTSYPSNYAPLWAYVAYNADGSTFNGQVQVYARSHMWFKDS